VSTVPARRLRRASGPTLSSSSTHSDPRAGRTALAAGGTAVARRRTMASADALFSALEKVLGVEGRVSLTRMRRGDWEARSLYAAGGSVGDVGRGTTAAAALTELLDAIVA
jgi:hypothetical protein